MKLAIVYFSLQRINPAKPTHPKIALRKNKIPNIALLKNELPLGGRYPLSARVYWMSRRHDGGYTRARGVTIDFTSFISLSSREFGTLFGRAWLNGLPRFSEI
jgi:hypothetical protein